MKAFEFLLFVEESELLSALNRMKKYCEKKSSCSECPFFEDGECYFRQTDPHLYDMNELAEKLTAGL